MDPEYNLQDVIRCHRCDNPMPPFHCDTCDILLCKDCKKKHIFAGSTEHKIVPYQSVSRSNLAQKADLYKTSEKLRTDMNKNGENWHRNIIPSPVKQNIDENQISRQFGSPSALSEKDGNTIPSPVKQNIDEHQTSRQYGSLSALSEKDGKTIPSLAKQNDKNQNSRQYSSLSALSEKDENTDQSLVNEKINENRTGLQYGSFSALSEKNSYTSTIQSLAQQKINKNQTSRQYGSLSALSERDGKTSLVKQNDKNKKSRQYGSMSALSEEDSNTIDLPTVDSSPLHTLLIDEPRSIITINTEYGNLKRELYLVSCGSEGHIWICGNDNMLRLYTPRGEFLRSIQTKTGNVPEDIAVTKSGDLIYIDIGDSTVNIVKETEIHTLIMLQGFTPRSVCSTSTGDLLVIMEGENNSKAHVVRYSGSTEKQRFSYHFGNSIKYITENKNLDICVADCKYGAVVVYNQDGIRRFTYTGPPCNTKTPFTPYGITTDSQSRILTAELFNECIHILDKDGQFLRYIKDCKLFRYPWGLCVDTTDTLFVAESDAGKVKRIQYSEEEIEKKAESIRVRVARFFGIIN